MRKTNGGYGQLFVKACGVHTNNAVTSLRRYLESKGWPDESRFEASFLTFNLYHRGYGRLILESLEAAHEHREPADLSAAEIEHIMPRTLSEAWKKDLGDEADRIYYEWLHTPGNQPDFPMMTLRQLAAEPAMLPTRTTWYLTDLAEARGKHELFTRQSPQKLKVLREHALIESAISSNRIEGVEVDKSRVGTLIFGKPALRDRDEEEVRGYRDALKLIHERGSKLPISEATIKRLHKLCRGKIWDAGQYKEISLERLIQQNKERYYEVLERSSRRWHEGKHDPWPTINFLLFILTQACKEFEQRVGQLKSPRGEKTEAVLAAIDRQISTFRVTDLQAECPGVGLDLIRKLLARLQKKKKIKALGTGRGAKWGKLEN